MKRDGVYIVWAPKNSTGKPMPRITDYRSDGNLYCADECKRCGSVIYTHAMQNIPWIELEVRRRAEGKPYRLCDWCRGLCTAAEQDRRNAAIEQAAR